AAELKLIMGAQWDTAAGWALGPEAAVAWKAIDPDLPFDGVITEDGQKNTESLAEDCILRAALEGELRSKFGGQYFEINPAESAPWARIVDEQTPPPLPASMPVFVAQGTADEVVLPWPQAVLQEKWCAAGSNLTMLWMGDIDHMAAAKTAGPQVVTWIADRFAGKPATPACDGPMPVPPAPPAN
ncbi:MAG: lipase family protein, partial [Candidatus Nanopelagicales bacterium]